MTLDKKEIQNIKDRYTERFTKFGYSPKALGWDKGKQSIRFDVLTSQYNFKNKHVLDVGCGFGDLNKTLVEKFQEYQYTGVELVDALFEEAKSQYQGANINFINRNILDLDNNTKYDFVVSSGIFNHKHADNNNYVFIESVIKKALDLTKDGIAFDFLSDKVDYQLEHTFHSSPERILSIAYKYSRNVMLRNDYMPFEFSLFIFKDDSFSKGDTIFNLYKECNDTF